MRQKEHPMRRLGTAAIGALLAGMTSLVALRATSPAYAQAQTPNINLLQDAPSKTPEEREADEVREKAYKDSLRKIPEAKAPNDPWGGVRSSDGLKTSTAKNSAAKNSAAKNLTAKNLTAKNLTAKNLTAKSAASGAPASAKKTGSNAN
jgi:DMSO/TMAO reductase YedYZ molybdopterin-dependent catalytic subunit